MSNSQPQDAQPLITGKRKRILSYDELDKKFQALKEQYNSFVVIYNELREELIEKITPTGS